MLEVTDGYRSAIVGDVRQMYIKAVLEIIDPDVSYGESPGSGVEPWAKLEQLHNKEFTLDSSYATLERGRWLLDGSFSLIPDDPAQLPGEVAYVGNVLSGDDGSFPELVYAEQPLRNVSILQACSVMFPTAEYDGVPSDFTVEVIQGSTAYLTKDFIDNTAEFVSISGFTVYNPDVIRITVTRWSLPGRRMRIPEIVAGVYEEWTEDTLASLDIQMRANFSCLSLPYGTCVLRMDNLDRRFEPRSKDGVFQSIEERQGIPVYIGVRLPDGRKEYKRLGVFFQYSGGWRTGDNAMTMEWTLVDIVGLVANREFVVTGELPTTLSGWLKAIVSQLGENFVNFWHVDPNYADASVVADSAEHVRGRKCGDILRFACMASGTWPRADAETGYLTAEPLWDQGNKYDLDNMTIYPVMKANEDIAVLTFKLYDGNDTTYLVSGNSTSSNKTLTIDNPFIHTTEQALTAARQILSQYGGIKLETIGRGDPASELGDVDTVWLNESSATTGRRMDQSFQFSGGFLRDCRATLLQADGSLLYEGCALITQSGTWTAPPGKKRLRVVIGQGAQGGMKGQAGTLERGERPKMNADTGIISQKGSYKSNNGAAGEPGIGGKIWFGTIDINEEQAFEVHIGKGGAPSTEYGVPGAFGEETTFGPYTSAGGEVYPLGFTDIANGDSYGRTGVAKPKNGTSDGAAGGAGGAGGIGKWGKASLIIPSTGRKIYYSYFSVVKEPEDGKVGPAGADGFVLVYWDKEDEA